MTEIFFVLPPDFLLLDLAGPAEAFRIAQKFGADIRLHFSADEENIASSIGVAIAGVQPLPETLPDGSLIVIAGAVRGGEIAHGKSIAALCQWLANGFDPTRNRIACICSGALLAARAGILDGRRCTTHHSLTGELARLAPSARVEENRIFVEDGQVLTSAGIMAGVDLALYLIADIAGDRIAMDVAREMVVYLRRSGEDEQLSPWLAYRNHLHPAVHRAQDIIAHDPAQHWTLAALAASVHVSPRHLTRLFRDQAGISIVGYQQRLRVSLAKKELRGGQTVDNAALIAGFESARSLRRLWPRFEDGTPGEMRGGS